MIQQEVKIKPLLSSVRTEIKKRGHRKSVSTYIPKLFLSGKSTNPTKKNEINQNNNNPNNPNDNSNKKSFKKFFIRKNTVIIKENKKNNNNEIIPKKQNSNKNITSKNIKLASKTNQSFHQLEKIVFKKFYDNYTKYYYSFKKINDDNDNEKVSIYDYYQLDNITSNKKCKIKIDFNEYNQFFNYNEYIMDYFGLKECNYMLLFLLFFIYKRDIYIFNKEEDKIRNKTIIFRSFVKTMLQRIEKINDFKNSILYQMIVNIKEINNKLVKSDSNSYNDNKYKNSIINNNDYKYFLGKEIKLEELINSDIDYSKFLPILINISFIITKTCLPNTFCFGQKLNFYLNDFFHKRKVAKIMNFFNIQTKIKSKYKQNYTKRPSTSRKINYNKSFYNENIAQEKNSGISFVTIENLNDKLNDDRYYDYTLETNNKRNILRRAVNDPEIKDIELFLNNLDNYHRRLNKKPKSIKFTIDIKDKKEKDALLKKMIKRKENKSSTSMGNINQKLFNNLNSKFSSNNRISILKNLNHQFSNLKNNSNNKNQNININITTKRKYSFQNNKKDKNNSYDKRTINKNIINNDIDINIRRFNRMKSTKIINQYSFINKTINKLKNNTIKNKTDSIPNITSSKNYKDTIYIPCINSITMRKIKNKRSDKFNNNKNNSSIYHKSSISSLSSRRISIRKSDSTFNINNNDPNNNNEKNKKYHFKKIHEFIFELLRQSNKYDIKNLLLENINSVNRDPNNNFAIEYKNYFRRRIFRYFPPKYFESNDNVWKNGEFRDSRYKSNYLYNLLMMKIQKQMQKSEEKYKNLLNKEVNIRQISKSADIYL